ncbi:MAG: DNA topoisomerase IV subunit A [Myxococcota bacterium]|nr:DNA topoisomerase IV subunit A [Myxococcota bacterium]
MARLETMMREHFVDYASYFVLNRAIPELRDGLKPVQRRILHTLFQMNDGRFHKLANVIGESMKLHPHGDASISDALVVLANKGFFMETQGNFGNLLTGHPPAAARYIECRLSPLALETLFNESLTEMVPSYDGRTLEPVCLPAKLPVALMLGTEGIAVGMATKILPHNLKELWEAQVAILKKKKIQLFPDFALGGQVDVSAYDDGRGKVEVRAKIETIDPKRVKITEIPHGTTTESLIASIESAVQKDRVKLASIDDFTTDHAEIELTLSRGVRPVEVIPQLYAYTDCSVTVSSNITVIRDRKPVSMTVSEILRELTGQLVEQLQAELEWERERLLDRQHWLTLEQIFIDKGVYKKLEKAETAEKVHKVVVAGMKKFEEHFIRPMVDDDVKRLLEIRIRRISAYDIERNREEIDEIISKIGAVDEKLANMKRTAIHYVESLLERYGDGFPRRTAITEIETVDKKAVARQNIKLSYDPDTGFFGSAVKGDLFRMSVSEYDFILAVAADGSYRIMPPVDKVFFGAKLLYCHPFDPDAGAEFTVVYRDAKRMCFGKRFRIHKFIRNKEYRLVKDEKGRVDLLLQEGESGSAKLTYVAQKRQRVKGSNYDLSQLEPTSPTARGARLAPKPVARVSFKPAAKKKRTPKKKAPAKKSSKSDGDDQRELF